MRSRAPITAQARPKGLPQVDDGPIWLNILVAGLQASPEEDVSLLLGLLRVDHPDISAVDLVDLLTAPTAGNSAGAVVIDLHTANRRATGRPVPIDDAAAILAQQTVFMDGANHEANIYARSKLKSGNQIIGPAIITEMDSTSIILAGYMGEIVDFGNIVIHPMERV